MISSILNKHVCISMLGLSVVMLLLTGRASLAFASTTHATISHTNLANKGQNTGPMGPDPSPQENDQTLQGVNDGSSNVTTVGTDQGNSGNQGVNTGFIQTNSTNAGNQISGQRKSVGFQANTQTLQAINDGGGGNTTLIGNDLGNSGNQGINRGFNQDNAGNTGNQVNNQGNTIGMQINDQGTWMNTLGDSPGGNTSYSQGYDQGNSGNQGYNQGDNQDNSGNHQNEVNNQGNIIGTQINGPGSQVDNSGSIIEHQTNYILLVPHGWNRYRLYHLKRKHHHKKSHVTCW